MNCKHDYYELELHRLREEAVAKFRDYQAEVTELRKLICNMQMYIAALEATVEFYANKAKEVNS